LGMLRRLRDYADEKPCLVVNFDSALDEEAESLIW
jgi:hypothetical protein